MTEPNRRAKGAERALQLTERGLAATEHIAARNRREREASARRHPSGRACPVADLPAVRADDNLIEILRSGAAPNASDPLTRLLIAWCNDTHRERGR